MTRSFMLMLAMVALTAGTALAQQVVVQPQVVAQPRVMTQPTRSYRSYSVNPTNVPRGNVGRDGTHAGESTWRHAGAKPHGHFGSGR